MTMKRFFICDSDGTHTHDLQNRNLTFYSTELRSLNRMQR